ncbi:MAG: hypothetical protein CMP23_16765 [Rickettsiales bacterium]|nr:hypothetical protein [Rickettsiales bacterium]
MSVGTAAQGDDSVEDLASVTAFAGPQREEFDRLRHRLQLTNLRIARLYFLVKEQGAEEPEAETQTAVEELFISDSEFQAHLGVLCGADPNEQISDPDTLKRLSSIDRAIAVARRRIQAVELSARRKGSMSRFEQLCARCDLSPLDQEILLIALTPELDRRYRRVYSYLHDDFSRNVPSVGLIVDILAPLLGDEDRLALMARFESGSPLIRRGLVVLPVAKGGVVQPLAQRPVRMGEAAGGWLLGVPRMASSIADRARFRGVPAPPQAVALAADGEQMVGSLEQLIRQSSRGVTVSIVSKELAGGRAVADLLAHRLELPVVQVELGTFLSGGERMLEEIGQVLRDAYLFAAVVLVSGFPDVSLEEQAVLRNLEVVWRRVQDYDGHIFLPTRAAAPAAWLLEGRHGVSCKVESPDFIDRVRVLSELLRDCGVAAAVASDDIETIASRYRLGRQQLSSTVAYARDQAWSRSRAGNDQESAVIEFDDLVAGARAQFKRDIGSLARRIEPKFGFDDLVLPELQMLHLHELLAFVERRGQVYESWGFQSKFPRGTGAKALFFGRSGTGKTMAAEVLAKSLGLDLFKVDLSSVVSKWVGETEKNLSTIFDRAEEAQAVLLFDEADSLFGARTNVGSAVDRYANLETNYLLQRIEDYDGIAILSSNLKQNIDEAFTRRFHFVIEFPFPDRRSREEIWQRAFPSTAPLADDVDFEFLGDRFKFTGGNIKNSVLRAAFLGATAGDQISMEHVLRGVLREYQNLEREPSERDFGAWWSKLRHLVDEDKGRRRSI